MQKHKNLFIFLFLIILVLIFFFDIIFLNKTFCFRDISRYFYPYKYFASSNIKEGIIPLWNPYSGCGMPFMASIQAGIFYPLSIVYYILPFQQGFNIFYALHYLLALIFMYMLARDFNFTTLSALFSAISFAFCGFLVSVLDTSAVLCSAIWVPLTFLLFRRSLNCNRSPNIYTVFAGISLSMEILHGDPVIPYCTFIILLIYLVTIKAKPVSYVKLLSIFLIAFGISAIQIIPFLEFLKLSDRLNLQYKDVTLWSMPFLYLINLLVPFSSGDITATYTDWFLSEQIWLKSPYMGILVLVFSAAVIINILRLYRTKDRESVFFFIILCISLILVLGRYTPLYKLLCNFVPGLSSIRYPVKFFFLTSFSLAFLSGRGIDMIISDNDKEKRYLKILIIMEIIVVVLSMLIFFGKEQILSFLKVHFYNSLSLEDTYFMVVRANEIMSRTLQMFAIFTVVVILVFFVKFKKVSNLSFQILMLFLLIIDIFPVNMKLNPLIYGDFYKEDEKNITFLKENLKSQRVFLLKDEKRGAFLYGDNIVDKLRNSKKSLYPNLGMLYGFHEIEGYESLYLKRHLDLQHAILKSSEKRVSPLLDLLGVKYVFAFCNLHKKFRFLNEDYVKIYENPDYLPRAFVINNAISVKTPDEAFNEIISPGFDPVSYAVIEDGDSLTADSNTRNNTNGNMIKPAIVKYPDPNTVVVEVSSDSGGYLVLTDTYYPGWKAYVDGEKSKIYRAYYTLRAVKVNKGKHTIKFEYKPLSFKIGLVITLVFLLAVILFLLKEYYITAKM